MIRTLASLFLLVSLLTILGTIGAQPIQPDVYEVNATSGPGRAFQPADVTIAEGTTVRWTKVGGSVGTDRQHTVTSTASNADGQQAHDGVFRGILSAEDDVFEYVFDEAGVFHYYCEYHVTMGMTGRVTVTGGADERSPVPAGLAVAALGIALLAHRRR